MSRTRAPVHVILLALLFGTQPLPGLVIRAPRDPKSDTPTADTPGWSPQYLSSHLHSAVSAYAPTTNIKCALVDRTQDFM